jgi:hypothetical protein
MGAVANMFIPQVGIDGMRRTVNFGLSTDQTTWNFRSAFNVAALNCLEPEYVDILPAYASMLDRHKAKLRKTSDSLLAAYRTQHGASGYRNAFDGYMTQVYNYFALPPTHSGFCQVALQIARESLLVQPDQLDTFAIGALARFEGVFEGFFRSYDQYRVSLASWDAEYGPPPPVMTYTSQPQVATVQGLPGTGTVNTSATYGPSASAAQPVLVAATPVVQSLPSASDSLPQAIPGFDPGASTTFVSQPVVQADADAAVATPPVAQPGFGSLATEGTVQAAPTIVLPTATAAAPPTVSEPVIQPVITLPDEAAAGQGTGE